MWNQPLTEVLRCEQRFWIFMAYIFLTTHARCFYSGWGCWSSNNAKYLWTKYFLMILMYQQHGTWRLLQAVCFVEEWNRERRGKGEPLISFVDISQTVTRMAQSTEDSKVPNSNLKLKLVICCNNAIMFLQPHHQLISSCWREFQHAFPASGSLSSCQLGDGSMPIDQNLGINIHWQAAYGTWLWPTARKIFVLIVAHWNIRISSARLIHIPGTWRFSFRCVVCTIGKFAWNGKERKGKEGTLFCSSLFRCGVRPTSSAGDFLGKGTA